jgi:hypothetical protein
LITIRQAGPRSEEAPSSGSVAEPEKMIASPTSNVNVEADALLASEAVASLPHLSLRAAHRRRWGSTHAALALGVVDVEALLALLGTPADAPEPCGRSPGRSKGRRPKRATRHPALRKTA